MSLLSLDLEEINNTYLQIEDYIYPLSSDRLIAMVSEADSSTFTKNLSRAVSEYEKTIARFNEISDNLTITEIVDGYRNGSRLLQANLSGIMYFHFDNAYLPVMVDTIRKSHEPGYRFLALLADRLNEDNFLEILRDALQGNNRRTTETALAIIKSGKIRKALPLIEMYIPLHPELSDFANEVIQSFGMK